MAKARRRRATTRRTAPIEGSAEIVVEVFVTQQRVEEGDLLVSLRNAPVYSEDPDRALTLDVCIGYGGIIGHAKNSTTELHIRPHDLPRLVWALQKAAAQAQQLGWMPAGE